jgi:ABC-2 type transport system permease protein
MRKEMIELRRNRAGLLVLLVMPTALVLVVSLVQDNVMRATGELSIPVLLVDQDRGSLGASVARALRASPGIDLIEAVSGDPLTEAAARRLVAHGEYPFLMLIAPGTSEALRARADRDAAAWFEPARDEPGPGQPVAPAVEGLTLYFDPAVQGALHTAVVQALLRVAAAAEARERGAAVGRLLTRRLAVLGGPAAPGLWRPNLDPGDRLSADPDAILGLAEETAGPGPSRQRPTPAQQNVPAWTLFGMFFIVVPLSGTIIRERETGTFRRLMTLPVSPAGLLAGKLGASVLVCLAQFLLMSGVGWLVLPWLGTSGLIVPPAQWPAAALVAVAAALAATGYGIMVGALARRHEQASMFGAVSVVIAAALGGIMVPAYVMPPAMQAIGAWSPLAWGLTAFQDIFVRGRGVGSVAPAVSMLAGFFAATMTVAAWSLRRWRSAE